MGERKGEKKREGVDLDHIKLVSQIRVAEMLASSAGGILMYAWYAALVHCPSILMRPSFSPHAAAVVVSPDSKRVPFVVGGINACLPEGFPDTCDEDPPGERGKMNRGPSVGGRMAKYCNTADTVPCTTGISWPCCRID